MRLITLQTKNTTYQMGVNDMGFLLHLYYGTRAEGDMSFLLAPADRGFCGNPYEAGDDRTFSADYYPLEYPCYGNGDFRSPAFYECGCADDDRGMAAAVCNDSADGDFSAVLGFPARGNPHGASGRENDQLPFLWDFWDSVSIDRGCRSLFTGSELDTDSGVPDHVRNRSGILGDA